MEVHFIDVGQGNMILVQIPNSKIILVDCNITLDNEEYVLKYVEDQIGTSKIDIFINSHRDADHMRGIKKLNKKFGIKKIWDSGVPGTTTDSTEYREYMALKREIGVEVEPKKYYDFGDCKLRIMNGKNKDFSDANKQSLVVKLEYHGNGIMLSGDTSYKSWKEFVLPNYYNSSISSTILLGSHHGSISFFDDPEDSKNYYVDHINKISPKLTVLSVGDNDTHPDANAVKLYKKYSTGYGKNSTKMLMTKKDGTIKFKFKTNGGSQYWIKQ